VGNVFRCRGSILLEVVVALALFVFAATVITGGLNTSVQEVERLRLNLHASNLAVSVLSELQMGLKPTETSGPNPFEPPFELWSWEVQATPLNNTTDNAFPLQSVEVVVRYQTRPIVRRLTQLIPTRSVAAADQSSTSSSALSSTPSPESSSPPASTPTRTRSRSSSSRGSRAPTVPSN
jgi:type II secretory pathway pseudopilin PulG